MQQHLAPCNGVHRDRLGGGGFWIGLHAHSTHIGGAAATLGARAYHRLILPPRLLQMSRSASAAACEADGLCGPFRRPFVNRAANMHTISMGMTIGQADDQTPDIESAWREEIDRRIAD
jgi:hypothetical protein